MPLVDPVLVLADRRAADEPTTESMALATRELLTAARRLGTPVTVLRARYPEPVRLAELVRELRPVAVLIPADRAGEQLAARLAVRLESGIVTDVAGVSRDRGVLYVIQEVAGGTCRIATELRGPTPIITVRRGVFPAEQDPEAVEDVGHIAGPEPAEPTAPAPSTATATAATTAPATVGATATTTVTAAASASPPTPESRVLGRRQRRETGRELLLDEADVVVAGGRGVGSAEGFSLLARVAQALGGRLGGTHTAGELGWCPEHARISLPGAQIRPQLYLAGGVSGSLRHRAAIRRARTVVAIDRDPAAPILREADFGIVGDLHEVLPALLEELARRPAGRGGRGGGQQPPESQDSSAEQSEPSDPPEQPKSPDPSEPSQPTEPSEPSELAEA
jgi:electron transfer flavoprotein alpha subunit